MSLIIPRLTYTYLSLVPIPFRMQWMCTCSKIKRLSVEKKSEENKVEESINYNMLNSDHFKKINDGSRLILTSKEGEKLAALVSLEDFEILQDFEKAEERIDSDAVKDARSEKNLVDWKDYKDKKG